MAAPSLAASRRLGKPLSLGALALVLAIAGCKRAAPSAGTEPEPLPPGAVPVGSETPPPTALGTTAPPPLPPMQGAPPSFAPIAKHADPSVVTITTFGEEVERTPFFGRVRRRETKGLGSGFVVDKDGIVLTNNHVVEGADQIRVKLSDDRDFSAKVVGRDPHTDIAVVRIDDHSLVPLSLGDSDTLDVGDWVVAIGNPFGLSHTVSAGIVSAKGRTVRDVPLDPSGYYDFLQTDASINPGNSGGPLLNLQGQVVGINTAIRGGGAQGIGFAIPINMVKQLLPVLLRDGHLTRSALGVRVSDVHDLEPEARAQLKLENDNGALVEVIEPGGPAQKAGLAPGDVIVGFEGKPIDRSSLLRWLASTAGVGRVVTVRVSRAGKLFDIKVTLGKLPETAPPQQQPTPQDPFGPP